MSDQPSDAIGEELKRAKRIHEERRNRPYDGVLGEPPEWVPEWHRNNFYSIRNKLLDNGSKPEEIRHWMDALQQLSRVPPGAFERTHYIPPEVFEDVASLTDLSRAISLGPDKGLKKLAGELASHGIKFTKGGTAKQGHEFEPKASIRVICEQIGSTKFEHVIDFLGDEDSCEDIFHSTSNPTGVKFIGVDDHRISYIARGGSSNKAKTITLSRLRNILSEIKKRPTD